MARGIGGFVFDPEGVPLEHDLQLDDQGHLSILSGLEEIKERAACRLLLLRGEDIFDRARGLPLRDQILERPYTEGVAATIITAELLRVEGINSVSAVTVSVSNRRLTYITGRIETDYGTTSVSVG